MKTLDKIVEILLIVGGLNWGFIGLADYDIIGNIFGPGTGLTRAIFTLIGVAALYHVFHWASMKKRGR
ncbi:MAG: DUF378 domain-containing protein [Chlamydiae bacterium]|nr:DUF378 domain-containing protein [Chlamydiota bacterium]